MRFSLRSFAVSHGAAFANANSFFYSYIAVLYSSSFLQAPLSVHGVSVFPPPPSPAGISREPLLWQAGNLDSEPGRGRVHHETSMGRPKLLPRAPVLSVLLSFSWCRLECWVLPWPLKDGAEPGPGELCVVGQELISGLHIFVCHALLWCEVLDLLSGCLLAS